MDVNFELFIALLALLSTLGTFTFGVIQLKKKVTNEALESLEERVQRLEKELKIRTKERDDCYEVTRGLKAENYHLYRELETLRSTT